MGYATHFRVSKKTAVAAFVGAVGILGAVAWLEPWGGAMQARADILRGQLAIRVYGLPAPGRARYAELLRERLGVQMETVAGCVVSEDLLRHTDAYNEVMSAEIARRHGKDALDALWQEAQGK